MPQRRSARACENRGGLPVAFEVAMPTLHITNIRYKRRLLRRDPKLLSELRKRAGKRARARERRGL